MKREIQGNLAGIKSTVLDALQALYEHVVPRNLLISRELLEGLAALSYQINREIALYINRRGQVIMVAVGDYGTVNLPEIKGRKDPSRLSGVRCIHTHPESGPELSALDLTSLINLKLDCMAAVEVRGHQPGRIQVAYLQPRDGVIGKETVVFELELAELDEHPIHSIVGLIDRQVAGGVVNTEQLEERAILVALDQGCDGWSMEDSIAELGELARTAGAKVLGVVSQKRSRPDPATFIGQGKARELGMHVQEMEANCLIFDEELSPAQTRNLEILAGCKILDRTSVILDIFAARAQTREGKIQVELAQLKYILPRLTGLGTVLSRLGGGIGTRGPGETKLETDRRHIRRRISELEKDLNGVKKHRALQRAKRQTVPVPLVSLVGYTNTGKSSLLNALTNAQVLAEDKLFATLDPVTRRLIIPGNREILLTDTVGFVRKLPHHLVAAFRATLEEVVQADILIHVIDASHPGLAEQIRAVESVLKELGAGEKLTVMAFNKIDKVESGPELESLLRAFPFAVSTSALTGQGLAQLAIMLGRLLPEQSEVLALLPFHRGDLLSLVHREGEVKELDYLPEGVKIRALIDPKYTSLVKPFLIREEEKNSENF